MCASTCRNLIVVVAGSGLATTVGKAAVGRERCAKRARAALFGAGRLVQ